MSAPLLSLVSGFQFGLDHVTTPGWAVGGVLAVLSIISWSVLVAKWHLLARASRANRHFREHFQDSSHPLTMYLTQMRMELSPMYHVYQAGCRELVYQLVGEEELGRNFSVRLQGAGRITPTQMRCVQEAMAGAFSTAATRLEARVGAVATVLAIAPFLGLLGTVWGILEVFATVAQSGGKAGMAVVAPGIASALITTLVALLVALPSLVGHNLAVGGIRDHLARMDAFAGDLTRMFEREFVDHRLLAEPLPSLGGMGAPALSAAPRQSLAGSKSSLASP